MKLRRKSLAAAAPLIVAMVMLSGTATSATANYTASSYPTTWTAESALGNDVLKTEAGSLECKVHYEGTLSASSSTLTVKAKYTSCKSFGFLEAAVSMGSCDYLFKEAKFLESTESSKVHDTTAAVDLKCTNSAELFTIKAGTCKVSFGEQSPGGHVILSTTTATGDVDSKFALTGIKYTVNEDGFACPFNGTGAKEGASYTQGSAITFDSTNGSTIDIDGGSGPPPLSNEFTASTYPTTATGESALGNDTLTTEAGKVECKAHYSSTLAAKSSTLTVTPTYSECKAFGFLSASVEMKGCDYILNSATVPSSDISTSKLDISCPTEVITIKAATCTMLIGPQKGLSKVTTTNNTAAGDLSVQAAVTGIEYFVSQDGFGCPFGGTGRKTGAEFKQDSAITFDSTNGATIDVG